MIKIRRLLATLTDYFLIFFTIWLPLYIIQHILKANMVVLIIVTVLALLIFVKLVIRKDNIFGNRSIGKKLYYLKIFSIDSEEVNDNKVLNQRNIETLKIFPLYIFMILINNKSFGDIKLKTVIKSEELNILKSIRIMFVIFITLILYSILYTL